MYETTSFKIRNHNSNSFDKNQYFNSFFSSAFPTGLKEAAALEEAATSLDPPTQTAYHFDEVPNGSNQPHNKIKPVCSWLFNWPFSTHFSIKRFLGSRS